MKNCIAILLLSGFTQAAILSSKNKDAVEEATEELSIKMPEVVAQQTATTKPQASLSLVQSEANTQLGMFESGVLHGSLKPIVKAKVKKVMNFIQTTKDQYEHGTEEERKSMMAKAESFIMTGTGTRGYNEELCAQLWTSATEAASTLSFFYCPSIVFPSNDLTGTPPMDTIKSSPESRLRSAFLTQYFWNAMLSKESQTVTDFLAPTVSYYWGNMEGVKGKEKVSKIVAYIGFPEDSSLGNPVEWHCDTTTCIAPLKAWAQHENYCLTTFDASGLITEIIIPLQLWR